MLYVSREAGVLVDNGRLPFKLVVERGNNRILGRYETSRVLRGCPNDRDNPMPPPGIVMTDGYYYSELSERNREKLQPIADSLSK